MVFNKKCPICKKAYQSEVRHQKYCSSECADKGKQKVQAKKVTLAKNRRFANENKQLMRIKSRSHALAVEILKFQFFQDGKTWQCECGCDKDLEVHHQDRNFLNNTPSNLEILCTKCHAKKHSEMRTPNYEPSFYTFVKDILK